MAWTLLLWLLGSPTTEQSDALRFAALQPVQEQPAQEPGVEPLDEPPRDDGTVKKKKRRKHRTRSSVAGSVGRVIALGGVVGAAGCGFLGGLCCLGFAGVGIAYVGALLGAGLCGNACGNSCNNACGSVVDTSCLNLGLDSCGDVDLGCGDACGSLDIDIL